jgi:hypothetical protein
MRFGECSLRAAGRRALTPVTSGSDLPTECEQSLRAFGGNRERIAQSCRLTGKSCALFDQSTHFRCIERGMRLA